MDYSRFMNNVSRRRKGTMLRKLFSLQVAGGEGWIFVTAALPNESLFPFVEGSFKLRDGTTLDLSPSLVQEALQYGPSSGYPPLIKQLKSLVVKYHQPPNWANMDVLITSGAQGGLSKAIDMMMEEGSFVLTEEPCYSAFISLVDLYNPHYLTVETNEGGINPQSLREILSTHRQHNTADNMPKFLCTTPSGANPTGTLVSEARRREIYDICCEYDLLILEDDPYYFLQYSQESESAPSYLSLDREGRVLRFDSFSKVIGGGLRLGYATGPKPLIERLLLHTQITEHQCSGFSQVILSSLLCQWGDDGFKRQVDNCREFYRRQQDITLEACEKHLTGLCEWRVPKGGLFLWLKVIGLEDVWDMVMKRSATKKVVLVPGHCFSSDSEKPCPFLRFAFSHNSPENIKEAIRRFSELVREELQLQSTADVKKK